MTRQDRLIDLVYVGPDKAASTWLWTEMLATASISTPSTKDLFFFDRNFRLGMDWYWRQFRNPDDLPQSRVMEFGHDYIYSDEAIRRIHQHNPQVTYVMMLRDPLERAASAFLYMKSQGRLSKSMTFDQALSSQPELIEHGLYGQHLAQLQKITGTTSIALLDFHLLKSDRAEFAKSVQEQLGIADFGSGALSTEVVNPSRAARSPVAVRAGRRTLSTLRRLGLASVAGKIKTNRRVNQVLFRSAQRESVSSTISALSASAEVIDQLQSDADTLVKVYGFDAAAQWSAMR